MHPLLKQTHIARPWMWTGVASLALGGIFAVLLVLSRTPGIQENLPFINFFHTALIVHVDLTVLVWFLANAAMLWGMAAAAYAKDRYWGMTNTATLWCFWLGMLTMVASAFVHDAHPLINNYVPVLQHPLFMLSLGLIAAGVLVQASTAIVQIDWWKPQQKSAPLHTAIGFAIHSSAFIALASLAAVFATHVLLPADESGISYYEVLFWAGGHMLQFSHTQLLLAVWMLMALMLCPKGNAPLMRMPEKSITGLLFTAVIAVIASLYAFAAYSVQSYEFRQFFTWQMIIAGGIYVVPIALAMLALLRRKPTDAVQKAVWWSLLMSISVFLVGGAVATMIREVNLVIPAHYHGSIVGVSLAYMGLYYALLPEIKGKPPVTRWARVQPVLYGGGQLLFVIGYFIAGHFYDVARKTTESYADIPGAARAMHLANGGGGLAIIGGMAFVIILLTHMRKRAA